MNHTILTNPDYSSGQRERGTRTAKSWGIVALAGFAAIVFVAILIAVFGALFMRGVAFDSTPSGLRELPPVSGAPDADLVMAVTPVMASGPDVDRFFVEVGGAATTPDWVVAAGSPMHIATVETQFDSVDIFRWSEVEANTAPVAGAHSCLGGLGGYGGFSTCGAEADLAISPSLGWGQVEGEGGTAFDVNVSHLPAEAAWVVVDTESGYRIAAQTVDGVALLQWAAVDGSSGMSQPVRVQALDSDFEVVWTGITR